eukprot:Amastigsp_a4025_33.p4 type:complete len:106 gc:universal Amastigsp_a4025_33:249-566(+)
MRTGPSVRHASVSSIEANELSAKRGACASIVRSLVRSHGAHGTTFGGNDMHQRAPSHLRRVESKVDAGAHEAKSPKHHLACGAKAPSGPSGRARARSSLANVPQR